MRCAREYCFEYVLNNISVFKRYKHRSYLNYLNYFGKTGQLFTERYFGNSSSELANSEFSIPDKQDGEC